MDLHLLRLIAAALLLAAGSELSAGTPEDVVQLPGIILDSATGAAVPYASITLSGSSISNVSNSDGAFLMKIPSEARNNGQLTISRLGYATTTVSTAEFGSERLVIRMVPVSLSLNAAIVRPSKALDILFTAFESIGKNYPQSPMGLTSFYREVIRKGDSRYLSFNEAVIDINKAAYSGVRGDKAGIYKSRGQMNYSKNDSLLVNYQGGVMASLWIDVAKHPFAGVDIPLVTDVYDFSLGESECMDGNVFYVINFNQKHNVSEPFYRGRVFIDSESYAIGRVEMDMNVEGNPEAVSLFLRHKPAGRDIEIESASHVVNYKKIGDKWYFDYSRICIKISERRKMSLFRTRYQIVSEMAVTDRSPEEKQIDNAGRIRFSDILSNKVSDFADDNFWEGYNTIEPDKSLDVIIKKIIRQLRRRSRQ